MRKEERSHLPHSHSISSSENNLFTAIQFPLTIRRVVMSSSFSSFISSMGTRLFLLALFVPFSVSLLLSKQGNGSRDRKVLVEQDRAPQKRSFPEGMKSVAPPGEVYQQEAAPLGRHNDSMPLYLITNPSLPPSSFPVVAKVVNEEGERTRGAMGAVKDVAGALLTMHSYKKGNCPYCRGKGGNGKNAEEYQQECPYCPSGKCPWCHGKGQPPQEEQQEEEGEQCPNCPSGKCPWCHGKNQKNQQATENNGRCPNCPSGKCPWCHGKNRQVQQEEEEYEDDEQGEQQQCPNCPSGKCPWCHGKNNNNAAPKSAANSYNDYSKMQKGGGEVTRNEEQPQGEECPNCPSGRCPWCGGALTGNGKCAGCPDGKCPWCHRNLETGEGPDGSAPPQRCPNCPSGKCPWCHGKKQDANQSAPTTYSAYNNQPTNEKNQVEEQEQELQDQQQCPNCPSGRCPWCGGALTGNGKCAGCPDGRCPWCHRNLQTGEGPDGSPPPNPNHKCPNCPSGKCPWCHGKNQEQNGDAPGSEHRGYNNGQSGGCPYCPSGKCPWCHGKGQPPQQPQTEVEYEYEDEPEEQTQSPPQKGPQSQQWKQNQAAPPTQPPSQSLPHYGPPPGYQPQTPQTYANAQIPGSKPTETGGFQTPVHQLPPTHSNQQPPPSSSNQQPQQEEYEYEEEPQQQPQQQPLFGVNYGAIPSTGSVANYQAPGPAPTTPAKFRTGITSAVAPVGSLSGSLQSEMPQGVTQSNGAGGCCVISLPPGRYRVIPDTRSFRQLKHEGRDPSRTSETDSYSGTRKEQTKEHQITPVLVPKCPTIC